jgi:hypothetical protein
MEQMWDSSNYRGISLLVRCNKIYVKILGHRINEREGNKYPKEYQYGFLRAVVYRGHGIT